MTSNNSKIGQKLASQPQWVLVIYASLAAFFTYSCMYAFRRTFTAATFDDMFLLGVHYKIWLITSQLLGYTFSKFIGIKLVSEMKPQNRAIYILAVIGLAQLALFLFAVTPRQWNIIWMFFNGLPLGVVWGLVFSYLEGRRTTEIMGAAVSVSFIFASGFVKSIGRLLLVNYGVSEIWMPFVAGAIFSVPLIVSVWLLNKVPPPTADDIAMRTERKPMTPADRKRFLHNYISALLPFTVIFVLLTVLRDIRDNFAAEIWTELGMGSTPSVFTTTEIPVGIGVLLIIALMATIKNNQKALYTSIGLIASGLGIAALSTIAFQKAEINGIAWMILVGFGLYLSYITYHALLFERFIATFKQAVNIGFLFYFSDAIGYLGSISTFLTKNFFSPDISWIQFFSQLLLLLTAIGLILCATAVISIRRKIRSKKRIDDILLNNQVVLTN